METTLKERRAIQWALSERAQMIAAFERLQLENAALKRKCRLLGLLLAWKRLAGTNATGDMKLKIYQLRARVFVRLNNLSWRQAERALYSR